MRILHVLHNSVPYLSGYSIRSEQILVLQMKMGFDVVALTSAQQPEALPESVEKGIRYMRTPPIVTRRSPIRELQLMQALRRRLDEVIAVVRPEAVHAHSPSIVGLPAYRAARHHGLPFVYEVRDLWENASVDRGKFRTGSLPYRAARGLETWILRRADAIVTIGETLRRELTARSGRHVEVVPNGADPDAFRPTAPQPAWLAQWNPRGKRVIAYIGAFQPYEGLPLLLSAMRQIAAVRKDVHLLIVGDGPERSLLSRMAEDGGLAGCVTFTGRLPHARVGEVYSVADLLVYPRLETLTTRLTTPLKPLEALAMEKAVLASDLPAMREVVAQDETGLLFRPGDAGDLAAKALALLDDGALRTRLGGEGRRRILEQRSWEQSVARYKQIYAGLRVPAGKRP